MSCTRDFIGVENHTLMSDGYYSPGQLPLILGAAGYDVIAVTDHQHYTEFHPLQQDDRVLILNGIEWWHPYWGCDVIGLGIDPENPVLSTAEIAWIAHPKYMTCSFKDMIRLFDIDNIIGLELYNNGEYQLTEKQLWELEDYDIRYLAVDDMHVAASIMTGWIEMEVDSIDEHTVLENLKSGDYWMVIE